MLAPEKVLERGYSIVEHRGTILRDSTGVGTGDTITVRLAHGRLAAEVKSIANPAPLASQER
jgi:exodeoxyribonuclease VII large subunit